VESDYLAVLGDAVTPDRWRKIVERAISDAETVIIGRVNA